MTAPLIIAWVVTSFMQDAILFKTKISVLCVFCICRFERDSRDMRILKVSASSYVFVCKRLFGHALQLQSFLC